MLRGMKFFEGWTGSIVCHCLEFHLVLLVSFLQACVFAFLPAWVFSWSLCLVLVPCACFSCSYLITTPLNNQSFMLWSNLSKTWLKFVFATFLCLVCRCWSFWTSVISVIILLSVIGFKTQLKWINEQNFPAFKSSGCTRALGSSSRHIL